MIEKQLNDDEFRQWRGLPAKSGGGSVPRIELRQPRSEGERMLMELCGNRHVLKEPRRSKSNLKKRWTVFESQHFGIAVNLNGTVVVRGPRRACFTLWIRENGEAGTNVKNQLCLGQIANEFLILILLQVIDRIREWADNGVRHVIPRGPSLLLENARSQLKFRRSAFLSEDDPCGFYNGISPAEWPF